MAFDGIVMSALCNELTQNLLNGKIAKIAQPENDELLLTIKCSDKKTCRLLINADAGLPYICLTENNQPSPMTAPNFCMLLRKHIGNGRIINIQQSGLERILIFTIEHLDELGDLQQKQLIVEIMGKHSNIIFCDSNGKILDSIKHIPPSVSSLRTVLPGSTYFLPTHLQRKNPLEETEAELLTHLFTEASAISKRIYTYYAGISPSVAVHILNEASVDAERPANSLSDTERIHLAHRFLSFIETVIQKQFTPAIYYKNEEPVEFSVLALSQFQTDCHYVSCTSVSAMIEAFFAERSLLSRIRSKSTDLRKTVHNALERNRKKYDLQLQQLKDTQNRDTYRLYGELLTAYAYMLPDGESSVDVENYYEANAILSIPLDPARSVRENAARYYEKYNKQKRMYEALTKQIAETEGEIAYLESVELSLSIAKSEDDLKAIATELRQDSGYIRHATHAASKKNDSKKTIGKPLHYLSSDGFHIYVGRNNYQNEYLTFEFASAQDLWFHAKGIPGSHVIVKTEGKELPDRTYEEAAALAAYYSRGRENEKVEVDYTPKKQLKKPPKAHPGFVIYHTNYSMMAQPTQIRQLTECQDKK